MHIEGTKNFQRTVRAVEDKGFLTAHVNFDVYAVENAEWTPDEKKDFLRRVEQVCREVRDWLTGQINAEQNEQSK